MLRRTFRSSVEASERGVETSVSISVVGGHCMASDVATRTRKDSPLERTRSSHTNRHHAASDQESSCFSPPRSVAVGCRKASAP